LDSAGKIPDGVLADVTDICSFTDFYVGVNVCEYAPALRMLPPVPRGKSLSYSANKKQST
jgi:hypothetical protein